jgi:hypothetical protein
MAGWACWMVVVGFALLTASLRTHRAPPPVFTAPFLVTMDGLTILVFAALVATGLSLRHRPDWHRRLMLCATICVIQPALGRATVLMDGFSWTGIVAAQLVLVAVAGVSDTILRGRPHPALFCGAGAIVALGAIVPPLAVTAWAAVLTKAVAGS